jgi:hypothetical protein
MPRTFFGIADRGLENFCPKVEGHAEPFQGHLTRPLEDFQEK